MILDHGSRTCTPKGSNFGIFEEVPKHRKMTSPKEKASKQIKLASDAKRATLGLLKDVTSR